MLFHRHIIPFGPQQLFKNLIDEEDKTLGGCYLPGEVNTVHLFLCPLSEFLSIILGIAHCLILSNGDGAGKSPLLLERKLLTTRCSLYPFSQPRLKQCPKL